MATSTSWPLLSTSQPAAVAVHSTTRFPRTEPEVVFHPSLFLSRYLRQDLAGSVV